MGLEIMGFSDFMRMSHSINVLKILVKYILNHSHDFAYKFIIIVILMMQLKTM